MRIPDHPTLVRRMLDSRLKKLATNQPALAGSLIRVQRHCGNPRCHCLQGGPKHVAHQVTYKDSGQKSRSVYVPKDLLKDVQAWIAEHRRLKQLLQEINLLTRALVRGHVQQQKRRQGRS